MAVITGDAQKGFKVGNREFIREDYAKAYAAKVDAGQIKSSVPITQQEKEQKLLRGSPNATGAAVAEVTRAAPYQRDFAREADMAKKFNIDPNNPAQIDQLYRATYTNSELEALGKQNLIPKLQSAPIQGNVMGATGSVTIPGSGNGGMTGAVGGSLSGQQLTDMGLTPEVLKNLVASGSLTQEYVDRIKQTGLSMDQAKQLLAATPKPTNSSLGVLESALKGMSGVGKQPLGTSDLYAAAGVGGYAALAQSLAQHRDEIGSKYSNYANMMSTVGTEMVDTYNSVLTDYKQKSDDFNIQANRLERLAKDIRDNEQALLLLDKKAALEKEALAFEASIKAQYSDTSNNSFGDSTGNYSGSAFEQKSSYSGQSGTPKDAMAIPNKTKFGQCGRYVNQYTGIGVGNSYASKMAKMDPSIKEPEAGMVFTMPYRTNGHTGFILEPHTDKAGNPDPDGKYTLVKDSNYNLDEKIMTHTILTSNMTGFLRVAGKGLTGISGQAGGEIGSGATSVQQDIADYMISNKTETISSTAMKQKGWKLADIQAVTQNQNIISKIREAKEKSSTSKREY